MFIRYTVSGNSLKLLRLSGIISYSVCFLNPISNVVVAAHFLAYLRILEALFGVGELRF